MKNTIEMAREAGMAGFDGVVHVAFQLEAFAKLVRADEREACAKVCEPSEEHRREARWGYLGGEEGVKLLDFKAADIRARGNT